MVSHSLQRCCEKWHRGCARHHSRIQLPESAVSRSDWPTAEPCVEGLCPCSTFQICAYTYACYGDGDNSHWLELGAPGG